MSNVEKLSVALTSELATMVRDAVHTGKYASSSEVIREALRDWEYNHALREQGLSALRSLWEEGIASGPSNLVDFAAIKAEARKRMGQ
ncbi:MAG: type II toxin-antitoxin system ParD family antitoxin [Candidatus Hydrogenedentes bacterium]|nr:type II toxin-antitoxin system ParD family antitoxin [Candidatus Hydrogenedentota bacterium]